MKKNLLISATALVITLLGIFGYASDRNPAQAESQASMKALQRCFWNYQSWAKSTTLKMDAPWSTLDIKSSPPWNNAGPVTNQFLDVNGDGLLDHIYSSYLNGYGEIYINECLLLNTGRGWTPGFKCVGETINGIDTFYGDCAG